MKIKAIILALGCAVFSVDLSNATTVADVQAIQDVLDNDFIKPVEKCLGFFPEDMSKLTDDEIDSLVKKLTIVASQHGKKLDAAKRQLEILKQNME